MSWWDRVFRWLLTPAIRVLDRHYTPSFQELTSRQGLTNAEIDHLTHRADSADAATTHLTANLNIIEDHLQRNQQAIASTKKSVTELSSMLDAHKERVVSLFKALDETRTDLVSATESIRCAEQELKARIGDLSSDHAKAAASIHDLSTSRDEITTAIDSIETSVKDLRNELVGTDSRLAAAENSISTKVETEAMTTIARTQQQLLTHVANLQEDYDAVKEIFRDRDASLQALNSKHESVSTQVTKLVEGLTVLRATTDSLQESSTAMPEIQERITEITEFLADAARERTILAESIDRLSDAGDES